MGLSKHFHRRDDPYAWRTNKKTTDNRDQWFKKNYLNVLSKYSMHSLIGILQRCWQFNTEKLTLGLYD
ncbi:hypothetical protein GCM10008933_09950 [Paenibacillus motobuensis]|uniref:Uncharacterized protein n=1 Tax=Paenibacillus motobuensis TaxID=295324 RepID=A0ABN0Y3S9_9BACL